MKLKNHLFPMTKKLPWFVLNVGDTRSQTDFTCLQNGILCTFGGSPNPNCEGS